MEERFDGRIEAEQIAQENLGVGTTFFDIRCEAYPIAHGDENVVARLIHYVLYEPLTVTNLSPALPILVVATQDQLAGSKLVEVT